MAHEREGAYGTYYGSYFNESSTLSAAQVNVNATYIAHFFTVEGWSMNAIAGILGNMQAESGLNPGRWQSDNVGNYSGGYGLVQWTPATNYTNWCTATGYSDPSEMDNNLVRIIYELAHGLQWIATSEYNFSFAEFSKSTQNPAYLASAFLKCYERAGVEVEETRRANATAWYKYLTGIDFPDPEEPDDPEEPAKKKRKGYNFVLFNHRRRMYEKRRF